MEEGLGGLQPGSERRKSLPLAVYPLVTPLGSVDSSNQLITLIAPGKVNESQSKPKALRDW